jgi:ketosteroid isomerase-like protein
MTEEEKRALIRQYLDGYNTFDVDAMVEPLHPDVEFQNVAGGEVDARASGQEEFREMAETAAKIFASRQQTVTDWQMEEDGSITIEIEYTGTLATDLPSGVQAGDAFELDGRSTFAFTDGKISKIVDYS